MINVNKSGKIEAITYLRVLAVLMILYDHIGAMRTSEWFVKKVLDFIFCKPLNIIQEFGAVGVSLFYLITGFLFLHTNTNKERFVIPALRKILKIYVSVIFSFVGFGIFQWGVNFFEPTYWSRFTFKEWLGCATLFNHFNGIGEVVNGTTWFLIPLFLFYLIAACSFSLTKKNALKCIVCIEINLLLIFVMGEIVKGFGLTLYVLSLFPFVFIPVIGMILYAMLHNVITGKQGIILELANYVIMVTAFYRCNNVYFFTEPYISSVIYAVLLLLLFLIWSECFKSNDYIKYIERISLSIYLVHMTWGGFLMSFLEPRVGFSMAFVISIVIVIIIASVHYCIIEKGLLKIILN